MLARVVVWVCCFNPRSREGSDLHIQIHLIDTSLFQSTLP